MGASVRLERPREHHLRLPERHHRQRRGPQLEDTSLRVEAQPEIRHLPLPDLSRTLAPRHLAVPWEGAHEIKTWTRFIESSIPVEEDRILLQMWMGYLLTRDTRQQKMMWFIGRTGSGKGTILRVIGKLLGDLTAGTQLERLGEDFGLEPLFDKQSITIGDADISHRNQAQLRALLLSIVGEDIVAVNRKGRPLLQMKLDARLTLASNRNIPFENAGGAISARMLCIRFPNSFRQNGDPEPRLNELDDVSGHSVQVQVLRGLDLRNQV